MRKAGFATYVQVTPCPTCKGKGKLIDSPCTNCHGAGLVRRRRKITVKIPMGIDEGYQLRLRGEGELTTADGEPGDLYVIVHVKPNPQFMREGDDIWHIAFITYPQATLGTEISVPTLDGPTTIRIHPGTQPGETITIRGKGMPHFRGYGRGDLLVRIGLSVPEKLTSQQRSLIEQLAKEFGNDVAAKNRKFHL
jgi:molecular chaperone DnaJ